MIKRRFIDDRETLDIVRATTVSGDLQTKRQIADALGACLGVVDKSLWRLMARQLVDYKYAMVNGARSVVYVACDTCNWSVDDK